MTYIRSADDDNACFLCHAAEGADDRATMVVGRSETCICLLNRYPYNNGHLLVAPIRHEAALEGLTPAEQADLMALTTHAKKALDRVCQPHGFNLGVNLGRVAGAGLEAHLHMHIIPRWSGDTNFVTTVASVKVIPQSLEEMWQLLSEVWNTVD